MANRLLRWFDHNDLLEDPANDDLSYVINEVKFAACNIDGELPESAEKTAGLRKLLEAKDCLIRAAIEARDTKESGNNVDNPEEALRRGHEMRIRSRESQVAALCMTIRASEFMQADADLLIDNIRRVTRPIHKETE